MKAGRQALGKGLGALLSSGREGAHALQQLPISLITPNRRQPRKSFNPQTLAELASTIQEKGVTQPVLVRRSGNGYELIAGERRWRAARQAGLKTIPALVREASDQEALELALVENLQREDLNAMEEAVSYQALLKDLTQEELAKRLGKDRVTISNTLRLLKLPKEIQEAVSAGRISAGHARAVLQLDTSAAQMHLYRRIIKHQLSVRNTEAAAQRQPAPSAAGDQPGSVHRATEEDLSRALGTKVRLRRAGKRGAIVIEFYSDEELDRLIQLLNHLSHLCASCSRPPAGSS